MRQRSAAVTPPSGAPSTTGPEPESGSLEPYRRLAEASHRLLSEHSLDALLDRIAETLAGLVRHDGLTIFQADEAQTVLVAVLARGRWADQIMSSQPAFGVALAGWAAEHREPVLTNAAHLDPRAMVVPGTPPDEPEALIAIPLVARDSVKGVLSIYRLGDRASFDEHELELAKGFGDAAALALDNADTRARLELQAQTDSLTGLYNHRYFHEHVRAELARASRNRSSVALLMLDIDDFKKVNDTYGHAVGDDVLRKLAEQLKAAVRGFDIVCRIGGEEFGVVMGSSAARQALGLAKRLAKRLTEVDFGPAGKVTISAGVAEAPAGASAPLELLACAEAAMMTAKARGKDQIVIFGEDTDARPDPDTVRDARGRPVAPGRLYELQRREAEDLKALLDFGRELAAAEGIPAVLQRVAELSAVILGAATTSVWLEDTDANAFVPAAAVWRPEAAREQILALSLDPADVAALAQKDEPSVLDCGQAATPGAPHDAGGFFVFAPVKLDGGRLCCIVAAIPGERACELVEGKAGLLTGLAEQAQLAISHAGSFESLEASFVSTIRALALALEPNEEPGSRRVGRIGGRALKVAAARRPDSNALRQLQLGALFHDIGTLGIPVPDRWAYPAGKAADAGGRARRPVVYRAPVDVAPVLAMLEEASAEADVRPALALVAGRDVVVAPEELRPALRRALLLLAAGGDPRRELELDGRAVTALAAELDQPERRAALAEGFAALVPLADQLPHVTAAVRELARDEGLAWRAYACALLADELD